MKPILLFILLPILLLSCTKTAKKTEGEHPKPSSVSKVITADYELYIPKKSIKAVLILFGGYPESISDIKQEFQILNSTKNSDVAVLLLNYNQKLWLTDIEKFKLASRLQTIIEQHQLPSDNIVIGGFSSGGNVSVLISNYIIEMKQFYIDPKAVFLIDSPIDLAALYMASEKNIARKFSVPSVQESQWIIQTLDSNFGSPHQNLEPYEKEAVFTSISNNTSNLEHLKNTRLRFYTEPDTSWWREERMASYDQMNAYYIKRLYERLKQEGFKDLEYIATSNKGYRSNGIRHPHSWSIVDREDLLRWILQ